MSLEGSNGALCSIATMHMRRHKLEGYFPLVRNELFVLGASFVVQDLEIDTEAALLEPLHDRIVRCKSMTIHLGLEGAH